MPTAIKLSLKTYSLIASTLEIPEEQVFEELDLALRAGKTEYYVRYALYGETMMPWLIYTEQEFLECFATMPNGIDINFVKVTQVASPG